MKSYFIKKSIILPLFVGVFTLFSCTAKIDGNITATGSAVMTVSMSLGQRVTALIRSIAAAGGQELSQILDGQSIARSMSKAPGIDTVTFKNTSPSAVDGHARVSQINTFLASADKKGIVTFEQGRSGGKCVFSINMENGSAMLDYLSSDISDYLNALMAPIATGEIMSKTEYLEVVASFYNKSISDEIASSRIRVSVDFPGSVTSAKGGTFSGKRVVFDIPLLDLLVLETPISYEVNWKN
ncbi:hypothetical protein R84B8_02265 [Treponema sp. R8-4-B8]